MPRQLISARRAPLDRYSVSAAEGGTYRASLERLLLMGTPAVALWTATLATVLCGTPTVATSTTTSTDNGDEVLALQREVVELKQQVKWLMQQQTQEPPEMEQKQQLQVVPVSTGPQQWLSVASFGAKADGATDDTPAFQAALDAAKKGGNAVVRVPAGTYSIRGHLIVPSNCELRGDNHFPYRSWGDNTSDVPTGTTLQAFAGANCTQPNSTDANSPCHPFILLQGSNAAVSGMSIVYPEQAGPQASAPVPYPWTIRGSGDDCTVYAAFGYQHSSHDCQQN